LTRGGHTATAARRGEPQRGLWMSTPCGWADRHRSRPTTSGSSGTAPRSLNSCQLTRRVDRRTGETQYLAADTVG
jgi:hypothetical protein